MRSAGLEDSSGGMHEKSAVSMKSGICENSSENRFPAVLGRFFEARCLPDAGPTQVTRRADLSRQLEE